MAAPSSSPQTPVVEIYLASTTHRWPSNEHDGGDDDHKFLQKPGEPIVLKTPTPAATAVVYDREISSVSRVQPSFSPEAPESSAGSSSGGSLFSQPTSNHRVPAASRQLGDEKSGEQHSRPFVRRSDEASARVAAVESRAEFREQPRRVALQSSASLYGYPDSDLESNSLDRSREASSYVWRVLAYLSFINPLLCLANALYTYILLLSLFILLPFRLLSASYSSSNTTTTTTNLPPSSSSSSASSTSFSSKKRSSFAQTLTDRLSPLLLLHLKFLYPRPESMPLPEDFDPWRLVAMHLIAPLAAVPYGLGAWVVAFVWVYTEVLLGEKNEGRGAEYRSFAFLKRRWEGLVLKAVRPKKVEGGF